MYNYSDAEVFAPRQKAENLNHVDHIFKEGKQELILTSELEPAGGQAVLHLLKGD